MKTLFLFFLVFIFFFQFGFSVEIENYISQSEFMICAPSLESLTANARVLMKRFYGKNYPQMLSQISVDSKSSYGIDIFDSGSMRSAGIDMAQPLAYLHISNQTGCILLPIQSKKTFDSYVKKMEERTFFYQYYGNYAALSENKDVIKSITNSLLKTNEGFAICQKKLSYDWKQFFVWVESKYLSAVSSAIGVSANMKIPYGFSAFTIDFLETNISVRSYAGIISSDQVQYMQNMRNVSAMEKYDILDYITGTPAVVGNVYLNLPMLYKYYIYIDSINILGLKGLVYEIWQKYRINLERDLINNTDGRFKIVIDKLDSINNRYNIYGSIGIKNVDIAGTFMESLKNAALQNGGKLYSFELFTKPFYHYESTNYSIYYGLIENEFLFSTEKEPLIQLVKNIYENQNGYLENLPSFFRESSEQKKASYSTHVDMQNFFQNIKTGFELSKDFTVGVKDVDIYGSPDRDEKPYGWNTSIDIHFYKP